MNVPGVEWVSLQKVAASQPPFEARDFSVDLTDFSETAALVANLDLVVTVDTSVAHLAGGLGRPVWVLLPYAPDWRWQLERNDSPWYPTARLFRQTALGDWTAPLEHVARQLVATAS